MRIVFSLLDIMSILWISHDPPVGVVPPWVLRPIGVLVLSSMALASPIKSSAEVKFAGFWRLNRELSVYQTDSVPGQFGATETMVASKLKQEWPIAPGDPESMLPGASARELLEATEILEIFQHGRQLTMNATGSALVVVTRTVFTDGQSSEQRFGQGHKGRSQGKWENKKFIVETKIDSGPKVTEIYELSKSGNRLHVSVKIENEKWSQAFFISRVYDRVV
jgi:hypothetical protein